MDDIEDIGKVTDLHDPTQLEGRHKVLPKVLRRKDASILEEAKGDNIPGLGSVYLKTWGCAHNTSDGEYMAGLLANHGYRITQGSLMSIITSLTHGVNKSIFPSSYCFF